jgi:hypothetical protein
LVKVENGEIRERVRIVCEEFGGIYPPFEAFYIHSIIYSAGRSKEAFIRYDVGLSTRGSEAFTVSAVHEALAHAASLSRFFWPSNVGGKRSEEFKFLKQRRAEKLRDAFNIGQDSPLKDRRLRDALEHFDERLDDYLLENDAGYFFPGPMINDHELADDPTGNIFKLVDPDASCFVLLGDKHFFAPIRKEVFRISEWAERMDGSGAQLGK